MRLIAIRRRPSITILLALLLAGCAASESPAPSSSASVAASSTVMPTPTASPTAPARPPSAAPTATLAPMPTDTPAPVLGPWLKAPSQSSVSDLEFMDVAWTGMRFVAIGWASDKAGTFNGGVFLDSTDGITWHRQPRGGKGVTPGILAVGPSGIVAVGVIDGRRASWSSADGLTWVAHPDAFPPAPDGSEFGEASVDVTDVVSTGNDAWLAVGRRDPGCQIDCGDDPTRAYVWTSTDGVDWTREADQPAFKGGGMDAVARTSNGFVAAGVASGNAAIWTSPDGSAWSRVPDGPIFHGPKPPNDLPVHATGVAERDGVIVVVGNAYAQDVCPPGIATRNCPGVRAWRSTDGMTWSKATVEGAKDGQVSGVATTPGGFLATGWSDGCRGGIWASIDGRDWRCDVADPGPLGFGASTAAASDTVEVAVGSMQGGGDEDDDPPPSSAIWYRTLH